MKVMCSGPDGESRSVTQNYDVERKRRSDEVTNNETGKDIACASKRRMRSTGLFSRIRAALLSA